MNLEKPNPEPNLDTFGIALFLSVAEVLGELAGNSFD